MRFLRLMLSVVLIFAIIFTSVPYIGGNGLANAEDNSSEKAIKTGVIVAAVVGIVYYVGNRINRNNKLKKHYKNGNNYSEQEMWEKAVESYQKCYDISSEYKDINERLSYAKKMAADLYVKKGDNAYNYKKYERALSYYEKALSYQPTSSKIKKKIDELGNNIVVIHYNRGRSYENGNEWEMAYSEYKKAYNYNSSFKDLEERFFRAKAKVEEDKSLMAILFFVNYTNERGLEKPLLNALNTKMNANTLNYYVIEQDKVQEVMNEQAEALSDKLDKNLALDIGRILGVDKSVFGEIKSINKKSSSLEAEVTIKITNVSDGSLAETIDIKHQFSDGVNSKNISEHVDELAEKIVKEMN